MSKRNIQDHDPATEPVAKNEDVEYAEEFADEGDREARQRAEAADRRQAQRDKE